MRTSWAADALVSKARFMKGARSDARGLSTERLVSPYRGPNDRKVFASAARNYQRYSALARQASSRGDRVAMENLYQHAEHYLRVMRTASGSDQ